MQLENNLSLPRLARRAAVGALLLLALFVAAPAAQAAPAGESVAGAAPAHAWAGLWAELGAGWWSEIREWLGGAAPATGEERQALDGRWEHHGVGMDPDGEPAPSAGDGDHGVGMDPDGAP